MYSLLNGFYRHWTRQEEYYIIIIGLDNAGKTTLLEKIKTIFLGVRGLSADKIAPTVGLNIGKITHNRTRLVFWDLGGQSELQTIWEKYYTECHGLIFVIDSTDEVRLEECKEALEKAVTNKLVEGIPILMLANKQDDIEHSMKIEHIKEVFNQMALNLDALDSRVLPISALEGIGVKDAIDWMAIRLQHNKLVRPPVIK